MLVLFILTQQCNINFRCILLFLIYDAYLKTFILFTKLYI